MANQKSSKLVVKAGMIFFDVALILIIKQYARTVL